MKIVATEFRAPSDPDQEILVTMTAGERHQLLLMSNAARISVTDAGLDAFFVGEDRLQLLRTILTRNDKSGMHSRVLPKPA